MESKTQIHTYYLMSLRSTSSTLIKINVVFSIIFSYTKMPKQLLNCFMTSAVLERDSAVAISWRHRDSAVGLTSTNEPLRVSPGSAIFRYSAVVLLYFYRSSFYTLFWKMRYKLLEYSYSNHILARQW